MGRRGSPTRRSGPTSSSFAGIEIPVLDASALVVFLVDDPGRLIGRRGRGEPLWAPHLIDAEVGHVLRRRVLHGRLSPADAAARLADLTDFPLTRASHTALLERAWELRTNLSFYDALYVALAEQLAVPLLTLDKRLAGAPGLRCDVEVL